MGGFSAWSAVLLAVVVFGPVLPLYALLKKMGRSGLWALLWLVVVLALYGYVVISYPR